LNNRSIGVILFCLWLIAQGMVAVLSLNFQGMNVILGIVAIIAGILILIGR
jgi:hypothetical protein